MQRSNVETKLNVTLQYQRGYNESGNIVSVDIVTDKDFEETYNQLCIDKQRIVDPKRPCYPAPTYKILLAGVLNGTEIYKSFMNLTNYHQYLIKNELLPKRQQNVTFMQVKI